MATLRMVRITTAKWNAVQIEGVVEAGITLGSNRVTGRSDGAMGTAASDRIGATVDGYLILDDDNYFLTLMTGTKAALIINWTSPGGTAYKTTIDNVMFLGMTGWTLGEYQPSRPSMRYRLTFRGVFDVGDDELSDLLRSTAGAG